MKLYYDDPLIAAYMAREFGVKYTHGRPTLDKYDLEDYFSFFEYECDGYPECPQKEYIRPKEWITFDIHSDSLNIFKPQMQDVGLDGASRVCKYVGSKWVVLDAPRHECEPVYPVEIISRGQVDVDLRRFFKPKEER